MLVLSREIHRGIMKYRQFPKQAQTDEHRVTSKDETRLHIGVRKEGESKTLIGPDRLVSPTAVGGPP